MRACLPFMHLNKDVDAWDFLLEARMERERPYKLAILANLQISMVLGGEIGLVSLVSGG